MHAFNFASLQDYAKKQQHRGKKQMHLLLTEVVSTDHTRIFNLTILVPAEKNQLVVWGFVTLA